MRETLCRGIIQAQFHLKVNNSGRWVGLDTTFSGEKGSMYSIV